MFLFYPMFVDFFLVPLFRISLLSCGLFGSSVFVNIFRLILLFFLYNLRSLEDLSFVFYLIFVGFFVMFSLDFFIVSLFGILLLSGGLFVSSVFINIFCLILLFFFLEFEAFKGFVFLVLSYMCIFLLCFLWVSSSPSVYPFSRFLCSEFLYFRVVHFILLSL